MTARPPEAPPVPIPFARSVALHLVPGAVTTVAYVLVAPVVIARGYPALFGLLLATLLVLVPLELAVLFRQARRISGTWSLGTVVGYREPLPLGPYVVWPLLLIAWGFVSSMLASPADGFVGRTFFAWLPSWFFVSSFAQFASFSRAALETTFALGIVVHIAGPIVEELYFRGYLLPRLSQLGRWAPLVHSVLFSVYHFWTPWQNVSRILFVVAISSVAAGKRNIYLGMLAHVIINLIVWSITFGAVVRSHP